MKSYLTAKDINKKYNIRKDTIYSWIHRKEVSFYKKENTSFILESDVIQKVYEHEYCLHGIAKKSGCSKSYIKNLCDQGLLDFYIDKKSKRYIFPVGTEKLVQDLHEKHINSKKDMLQINLAKHNRELYSTGQHRQCYVARLDDEGEVLQVFLNRNQAVRDCFIKKGLTSTKDIVYKYVSYNGALSNQMLDGKRWYGSYYKYIRQTEAVCTDILDNSNNCSSKNFVLVNEKGEETIISDTSKKSMALNLGVSLDVIYSSHYIDSGKKLPRTSYSLYTVGKEMIHSSKIDAMRFYRIGKDKFKKLYSVGEPIRGHKVIIQTSK
jgi:hypothetical protein